MAKVSKELQQFKEFLKLEEEECINLDELESSDELYLLIDTMNEKLFFLDQ